MGDLMFDLIAIGTGSAAASVASRCRGAGWSVAIIDSRPFGGTCALRGCDPKKVLVGAAAVIDEVIHMRGKGVDCTDIGIDWPALLKFKRSFTVPVPQDREESFKKSGIAMFHGTARFAGPNSIVVGEQTLQAKRVVIGTGMRPAELGIPGEEFITTSEKFLELDSLPQRVAFVGGGYISMEFAHVSARAGAQITVLHRGSRPLEGFDPDLVGLLVERSRQVGIDFQLETAVRGIERRNGAFRINAASHGRDVTFEADLVVHGAGRVPDIDDLDLVAGSVTREPSGIKVNEYLQSVSNPSVYAAGDAAASGALPLTPVAGYEGQIVAFNLINGNQRRHERKLAPTVAFTIPPIASIGLQEDAARKQGLQFRTNHQNTSSWYSSRRIGESHAASKVLTENGTDRILGAHLLDPHADELINVFALAMQTDLPASKLKEVIFAYPTHASNIRYML